MDREMDVLLWTCVDRQGDGRVAVDMCGQTERSTFYCGHGDRRVTVDMCGQTGRDWRVTVYRERAQRVTVDSHGEGLLWT